MNNRSLLVLTLIFCLVNTSCKKQDVGTDLLDIPYTVTVAHHISRDDSGANPVTDSANIDLMMVHLNQNLNPWKIYFETKTITFVDNTEWNIQFIKQDDFIESKVLAPYEDAKSLNVFYFNELADYNDGVFDGLLGATALFPHEGNNIKLSASAYESDNTSTLTHEVGHYLGLFHTSDDNEDKKGRLELVNGKNCDDAGDYVCDTPASPDLNDTNIDECTCAYIGAETDEKGDLYSPDVFNFMTQWAGSDKDGQKCRRHFTQGQVIVLKQTISGDRSYLIE